MFLSRSLEEMLEFPKRVKSNLNVEEVQNHLRYLYTDEKKEELNLINDIFESNTIGSRFSFLVGRFYTFDYTYLNITLERDFVDYRPLVLVLDDLSSTRNKKVKGFNLNLLPEESRMYVLEMYFTIFKKIIELDINNLENNYLLLYKYQQEEIDFFNEEITKFLPKISSATRYWNMDRINLRSVRVIRPQDYNILSIWDGFKKSMKGKSWEEVQSYIFRN